MSTGTRVDDATGGPPQPGPPEEVWNTRPGFWGWVGAVNHKQVGTRFLLTAFGFFLIGGAQAVVMRTQLGTPESTVLDPQTYNQLFTMHGTTMLFLFAVPVTEAAAIYFAPLMIGARDMPFPRLNAFGYWAYLFGGLLLYSSFLVGAAPDGGWFAYVPLTGPEYSPGVNMDFWLLGVTFVEISGIVASIEIIVLVLKFRAPGMTLSRMPLFVWAVLVTALMVLFAFPPLVIASLMLELDRKVGTGFFQPALGGDPLLWQHIFWWFGHPEVYIMSLPAFGIVSTIIPTFARTKIVGYTLVATSSVAIGIISFGVWVHHMFATGIPFLGLSLFAAGSLLVAIPSGVQIFAWIATLWRGDVVWRVPMLYMMGFFFIFVIGGVTGVMFAVVPFTWQAHDTYFVVAHFHYVIIGSTVFPVLGAVVYWSPKITGRLMSRRLGTWAFWVLFAGFNLTFFPQHMLGLAGMTRRIYTWPAGLGWELGNLLSTLGAYVTAAGIVLFLIDAVRAVRTGPPAGDNPWDAGTLEWATSSPPAGYNFGDVPVVVSRYPLWDPAPAGARVPGAEALDTRQPRREMLATTVLDAEPEEIVTLPTHSWWPLLLATAIAVVLVAALVNGLAIGVLGAGGVVVSLFGWLWSREDEPG